MADDVLKVKEEYEDYLFSFPNVVGVGIGEKVKTVNKKEVPTGEQAVVCFVKSKKPLAMLGIEKVIPKVVAGVKTDVVETGIISAPPKKRVKWVGVYSPNRKRTEKWRPVEAGVSCGHPKVSAGTLGTFVSRKGEPHILSNNHVLANVNNAEVGDPIIQPGIYDGGTSTDEIGTLKDFKPITFTESNTVDCAIATVSVPYDNYVVGLGKPEGITYPNIGMKVIKGGRTTGITRGAIRYIDATVEVGYPPQKTAIFKNQIMTDDMADGGDSGSILFEDGTENVVGLLFAGSDKFTIFNKIDDVRKTLGFDIL